MKRTRLALESLEGRETPAGVVNVTSAGGSVALVGDAETTSITINPADGGRLTIWDPDFANPNRTMFRLNGAAATTGVDLPGQLTGNMTIRAGAGADFIYLNGIDV